MWGNGLLFSFSMEWWIIGTKNIIRWKKKKRFSINLVGLVQWRKLFPCQPRKKTETEFFSFLQKQLFPPRWKFESSLKYKTIHFRIDSYYKINLNGQKSLNGVIKFLFCSHKVFKDFTSEASLSMTTGFLIKGVYYFAPSLTNK